ncbi:MAG: MFS transporter, partial [Deltaproteobacteria bacterium]|nr:MFS transporter [Deltaproteobacteria bacterium]
GALLAAFNWHAIFVALTTLGLGFLVLSHLTLTETLPPERRRPLHPRELVRGYATFIRTPGTLLPMAIGCASFSGQFAYISDSPFVLLEGYKVSERAFGIYFGSTAFALMLGSILGGRMIRAGRSPDVMIVSGGVLLAISGVAVAITTHLGLGIPGFLPPMIVYFFGTGMTGPSATALALAPVAHIAGTASAAIGFSMMMCGAIAGYLTTKIGGSSPQLFSLVVMVMGLLAFGLTLAVAARHVRQQR